MPYLLSWIRKKRLRNLLANVAIHKNNKKALMEQYKNT